MTSPHLGPILPLIQQLENGGCTCDLLNGLVCEIHRVAGELRQVLFALLNTPEIEDFDKAVPLETAHQVLRWGVQHDDGKAPEDWFWVVGYLAGKALRAHLLGDLAKAKHHCISTAAVLRNWHAHIAAPEIKKNQAVHELKASEPTSTGVQL